MLVIGIDSEEGSWAATLNGDDTLQENRLNAAETVLYRQGANTLVFIMFVENDQLVEFLYARTYDEFLEANPEFETEE